MQIIFEVGIDFRTLRTLFDRLTTAVEHMKNVPRVRKG
jgi:hypothetical protein